MHNNILIIGSGGHGKSVLDCVVQSGRFDEVVFASNADEPEPIGGYPVLDERLLRFEDIRKRFDAAVVAIGDNRVRLSKTRELLAAGVDLPVLVHPSASVSPFAKISPGTVILAQASVNAFASVGAACIVNTAAIVEHECNIGDGVHLSPGAAIGGGVAVGGLSWLCISSSIIDHITLAGGSVLAGGSCLTRDGSVPGLYAGSPATLKKRYDFLEGIDL
ncbi:UDP-N-acetylbacillosamine N-acetyltransferase [Coriobacteriaceae bacterium CHKCI002]|nr:UDP-N-acetylbacillosamine N-acetyltransferase [Coriobacteriaceae bacterium CHKCI002]